MGEPHLENPITATPDTLKVVVTNYTTMSVATVVILARFGLSKYWRRSYGLDDLLLFIALVAGVCESITLEHAVRRGLGTYIRPGNSAKLNRLSELIYGADLLTLLAMLLAKLSIVRTVYRFASAAQLAKSKMMILQICVILWAVFSIPAIAFQCSMPMPWLYLPERCAGSGALWYPVLAFSVLTDAWLAFCTWPIISGLSLTQKQRQIVLALFGSRTLVCVMTIIQLALLAPALHSNNQPRSMPTPTILKSFVQNASLITTALPILYCPLALLVPPQLADAVVYTTRDTAGQDPLSPTNSFRMRRLAAEKTNKSDKSTAAVKETEIDPEKADERGPVPSRLSLTIDKEISTFGSEGYFRSRS